MIERSSCPIARPALALRTGLSLCLLLCVPLACNRDDVDGKPGGGERVAKKDRPNVIWIVWDTVRADHLSLYGYERQTTPNLDAWAKEHALVYEDCTATASSTVPSHGAMFTGLLPSEHGANNNNKYLDLRHDTIAELLQRAGYRTFLWAANPHIDMDEGFGQGFDVEEHPYSPQFIEKAKKHVMKRIEGDHTNALGSRLTKGKATDISWAVKSAGFLAKEGVDRFLADPIADKNQPFFIFLNYMEAHRPYIPSKEHRARFMSESEIKYSYLIDRSWASTWAYTFGLMDMTDKDLEVTGKTYDATLAELDDLFHELITDLEAGGYLDNTVVILTADHGEALGDHHMLDHQYGLYQELIHVPLVIRYPRKFKPGREMRPVSNFDLFPTVLELVRLEPPPYQQSTARSLLHPQPDRRRIAQYPAVFQKPFEAVRPEFPEFDATPWRRTLDAYIDGGYKLVRASDDRNELYNRSNDPRELNNLIDKAPKVRRSLDEKLTAFLNELDNWNPSTGRRPKSSGKRDEILQGLGYGGTNEEEQQAAEAERDKEKKEREKESNKGAVDDS